LVRSHDEELKTVRPIATHLGTWIPIYLVCGPLIAHGQIDCPADVDRSAEVTHLMAEAQALGERGCHAAARDLSEQLLGRAEQDHGPESHEVAAVLDVLAESQFWLGERNEQAIERARRAVRLRERLPPNHVALARSYLNLGALLGSQLHDPRLVAEALKRYEQARVLWEAAKGAESWEVANLLTFVAELIDDWKTEGPQLARQLPWVADLTDPSTAAGRTVLETLAEISQRVGSGTERKHPGRQLEADPALAIALWAVTLARAAGTESPAYAESLNTLGNLLHRRQLYDEALTVYDECLKVRIRILPPGHPQIARAYHNRGEARMLVGDLEGARPDLETGYAMRLALAGERYPGSVASSLRVLGNLLFLTGDLQAAVGLYRDALPGLRASYGDSHWRFADSLSNLAEAYEELGEVREAERYYRAALAALERSVSSLGQRAALIHARLGTLLVASGATDAGDRLLLEAKRIQESLPERPLEDYAYTLRGLAATAAANGDPERAADLYREAVGALERYEGAHPALLDSLLAWADMETKLRRTDDARHALQRAEPLLAGLGPSAYAARAQFHLLRARLAVGNGRKSDALADAAQAAYLYARHLAPAFRVLPADAALHYALQNRESVDLALSLLAASRPSPESVRQVWQAIALHRGLVAAELEQRYGWAWRSPDPEILSLLANLNEARRHLAMTQMRTHRVSTIEERKVLLRYADARLRTAERALAEKAARSRPGRQGTAPELADLVDELPEGSALVAFVRFGLSEEPNGPAHYGAFVNTAGEFHPRFSNLGRADEIDRQVLHWRTLLLSFDGTWQQAEARLLSAGADLRQALWDPVARLAQGSRRFFVVPDGSLFLIPFEALPGSLDGTYLIEDGFEIHRLVSERDLLRRQNREPRPQSMLAVGGPDFDAGDRGERVARRISRQDPSLFTRVRDTSTRFFREFLRDPCLGGDTLYFLPLPAARDEAAEVAAIFSDGTHSAGREALVKQLSAADATEIAFKRLAPAHSILHVATHGFFDLECREDAASRGLGDLLLDDQGGQRFVSGLAFAGANRPPDGAASDDDGILTVPEIAALDLTGVTWVVLSACETGIGPVASGEGLLGLARSFRVAGAETLILSLWPVEDLATKEWMAKLYRGRFLDRKSTAAAMRDASLAILDNRRQLGQPTHPYFWAAFVAIGGWD
jgi:CHAT domain-containing protein